MQTILDLVLPRQCPGCGKFDTEICEGCQLLFDATPQLTVLDDNTGVPILPVWALGAYRDEWRSIILAAKHAPSHRLADYLWLGGTRLGSEVVEDIGDLPVWVVPVPSSHKRRWQRKEIVPIVAQGVAHSLQQQGIDAAVVSAVHMKWCSGSQNSRSLRDRRRGRHNSMKVRKNPPAGMAVIAVDDVFTTGATMQEMARTLGDSLVSAVVLASA